MNSKHYDLKKAIAITMAGMAAIVVASWYLGSFIADYTIVPENPSPPGDGAGMELLGVFFVSLYIVFGAGVGFSLGYFIGVLVDKRFKIESISGSNLFINIIIPVFIITLPLALREYRSGYADGVDLINCDNIKIFIDNGSINKETLENLPVDNLSVPAPAKAIDFSSEPPKIHINPFTVSIFRGDIILRTLSGERINKTKMKCTYITELRALAVRLKNNEAPFAVVLATLRESSYRAELFIYNQKGELIYREKIKRGYNFPQLYSYSNSIDNSESLVVQNEKNKFLIYKYNNKS